MSNKIRVEDSPNRSKNLDTFGDTTASCIICGKPTKEDIFVHLLTTGEFTSAEEDPQSQGSFPVGPDCAKKFPKEFLTRKSLPERIYVSKKSGKTFRLNEEETEINLSKEITVPMDRYKKAGHNNAFEVYDLKKSRK